MNADKRRLIKLKSLQPIISNRLIEVGYGKTVYKLLTKNRAKNVKLSYFLLALS